MAQDNSEDTHRSIQISTKGQCMVDLIEDEKIHKRNPSSHVRFTEREFLRIQKMQQTTGLTIPILLKKALFERFDLERPLFTSEDGQKIILELNRQGTNLNQIAKRINEGGRSGWNQAFNSMTKAYFDLRRMLSIGHGNS